MGRREVDLMEGGWDHEMRKIGRGEGKGIIMGRN